MIEQFRLPPQDLDAERGVLGAIVLDPSRLDEIDLRADEFYGINHGTVYATIAAMHAEGTTAIDAVTICERLIWASKLADVGGADFIGEVMQFVPHSAHAKHYAAIVRKKAQQREIIRACSESIERAYDSEPGEVVAGMERTLLTLREASTDGEIVHVSAGIDEFERRERDPAAVHRTGLADLDQFLRGGLRGSNLVIVAGRPGSGKSILSGQIAEAFARRGDAALVVSLEMDRGEIAERYVASVDRQQLRRMPLYLVDSAFNIGRICGLIRLAKRKHDIQVAVVDYLQLAESMNKKTPREQQVAEVSRSLKILAADLKIPIVAACQLNRGSEKESRRPRISDLRESGSLEQDADIVLLLHHTDDSEASECVIGKQRNGGTGMINLTFRGDKYRFENYAHLHGISEGF